MRRSTSAVLMLMLTLVFGAAVVVWPGSPAAARHNFSMLEVHPEQAGPGEEVTVSGFSYTKTAVVRFGAVDGPVLARLEPTDNDDINGTVRIPPDATPGRYILFAMHEDADGRPTRFPGRAAIVVAGPGGPPHDLATGLELEPRPPRLVVREGVSLADLILVALATAGVASLVAVAFSTVVARRRKITEGASP